MILKSNSMINFIPAILAFLFLFGGNISYTYAQIIYQQEPSSTPLFDGTIPILTVTVPGLNSFCLTNNYTKSGIATLNVSETELEFNYNSNSGYTELPISGLIHVGGSQIKRADNSGTYNNVEQDTLTGDDIFTFNISPYQEPLYAIFPYCINEATDLGITYNDLGYPYNFLSLQNTDPIWRYENCEGSYANLFPECDLPPTPTTTPTTTPPTELTDDEKNLIFVTTTLFLILIFLLVLFSIVLILKPFIYVRK